MKVATYLFTAIALIFSIPVVHAQTNDSIANYLFSSRNLDTSSIRFNSILLIPQLYEQDKTDTLHVVIRCWEHKEHIPEPLFSFLIIEQIKNGTFSEQLYLTDADSTRHTSRTDYYRQHIATYLRSYAAGCNVAEHPRKYFHYDTSQQAIAAYARYYQFLQSLAQTLCDKPDLTPAESFLVHFYACPDTALFATLRDPLYKGTVVHDAVLHKGRYSRNSMADVPAISGINLELNTGSLIYGGPLSALQSGAQPSVGFLLGGRTNKVSYALACNLSWAHSPESFAMRIDDSVHNAQYKGCGYLGLNLGYQLYRKNKSELDGLFGAGYSVFDAAYDPAGSISYHSPDISFGLGYRFYFRHRQFDSREVFDYMALQAKYHFLSFDAPGNSTIDGNAFSLSIAIGAYSHSNDVSSREIFSGLGNSFLNELLKRY